MQVTNALASNFILENLKIRESQALGTSSFLADEVEAVEKRLKEKEEALKAYREKYMGGLPEQLETNLRLLERLQAQLDQENTRIRDGENRRQVLQKELAEEKAKLPVVASSSSPGEQATDLFSLRHELELLESKYTANHPDVIRLKEMMFQNTTYRCKDFS